MRVRISYAGKCIGLHLPTHDFVHYTVFTVLTKCKLFTEFIENFVEIFENL